MHLSTKGRYAVRAMVDLARYDAAAPVPRADIAERQAISSDYLAQLFSELQRAGLVTGVKGPGGGYHLARAAAEIRVGDVVRAVEGPIAFVECLSDCESATCARAAACATRPLWEAISGAVAAILDRFTLQNLVNPGAADLLETSDRADPAGGLAHQTGVHP